MGPSEMGPSEMGPSEMGPSEMKNNNKIIKRILFYS
jgi:hypothetical protein